MTAPSSTIAFKTPAKVNLGLYILGEREDGFHELETLFAFVADGDRLTLAPAEADSFAITGPCAAALAALDLYDRENLFERAANLEGYWQDAVHRLEGLPNVIDIRDIGLTAGIELAPRDGAPGARGYDALTGCFEAGALVRVTGDTIALSPPLIIDEGQIDALLAIVAGVIENTG